MNSKKLQQPACVTRVVSVQCPVHSLPAWSREYLSIRPSILYVYKSITTAAELGRIHKAMDHHA